MMHDQDSDQPLHSTRTLILACIVTAIAVCVATFLGIYLAIGGADGLTVLRKALSIQATVKRAYVDVDDTNWDTVADGVASGFIASLGDRWSYYMNAEAYAAYKERSANQGIGIGITIIKREEDGYFDIISVVADSPSALAGLQAGDIITKIRDEDVSEMSASDLRERIVNADGDFDMTLRRDEGEYIATLHKDVIYYSPVSYRMLDNNNNNNNNIGYIRIANFESRTADSTIAAIADLQEQGASAMVFDVRADPGGQLTELIDILDALLPEGEIFISVDRDGGEKVYTSDANCLDMPMAVLINAETYSAAEYFAAVLREYDAARIFGVASTGKARSQSTYPLADGSAIHISTRRYLTPGRVDLAEQGGIVPDYPVEYDTESGVDTQLDAAVEYLLGQL